jgi:hypothetical protein
MAKIFVRERTRVGKGEGQPRFAIVGVHGSDLKFFQLHVRKSELDTIAQAVGAEVVRKSELDTIAQAVGAEVVMLPRGTGENAGEGSGGGQRQHHGSGRQRRKTADA